VCTPIGNKLPEGGSQTTLTVLEHWLEATTLKSTFAPALD